jgi:hypothetical protein
MKTQTQHSIGPLFRTALAKLAKLDKRLVATLFIIGLFLGLVLYPWPTSDSYGKFSGFDPANVYVQPNSNFEVQLNSNQISVESVGSGVEAIHFALSDLPYNISFTVTVRNQSLSSLPVIIAVSYPLNPNQIQFLFSSIDQFIHLELYNSTDNLIKNEKLIMYSIDEPVDFHAEISTVESSVEFIAVTIKNQTASVTASFESEVQSLLRDQARLVSVEVSGANTFAPGFFSLNGDQIWAVRNFGEGQGNSTLIQSGSLFSIVSGNFGETYVEHVFESPVNWTSYETIGLTLNGSDTQQLLRFWVNTDWNDRYFFYVKDDFVGPRRMFISLLNPDAEAGSPNLGSIERIGLDLPKITGTWGLSDVTAGKIESPKGAMTVSISDLNIAILPHSLAYAPLTPFFVPISILIVAVIVIVLGLYFSDIVKAIRAFYGKIKLLGISRVWLFAVAFVGIFVLYLLLFNIGDHAFDMFSQKLWSYDMTKYGLLSLYQRPAVTSAASMYDGQGTQNAIFAYAPLAGLYYYVIGQTYFLFSSSPSVYDSLLTVVVKSFQTITTLACGLLVFKLMRSYRSSWKTSFLTMIAFLLNPLVLYDAAVWGHQDSFLIFFLFLALWAYESNHPRIAFSAVALAIMVKATAFAPAALMVFLLIRKFGVRKFIDGALAGLTSAIAVIMPYVASGASPAMLINSTTFRVFQFGTLTFQYPRSAAVSPDGYNIWPLFTYLAGARSRDRMWFPDFVQVPFLGISILLVGEILFVSVLLILLYLATKKIAKQPGGAALLLGVLMIASTTFLTKTTARYVIFGVAFLIVSYNVVNRRIKWAVIGLLTFTTVFAMHGLLVDYTGAWLNMFPAMSPTIPFNGVVLSLYLSDPVISGMILVNLFAFIVILAAALKESHLKWPFPRH